MKLQIAIRKDRIKIVEDDALDIVFLELPDSQMHMYFVPEDVEVPDDKKERFLFFLKPEFKLSPADIKSSILAYLNSVPDQSDFAEAAPNPTNIMSTQNNMLQFMEEVDIALKKDKPRIMGDYGFIRGVECREGAEDVTCKSQFWFVDVFSGWKHFIGNLDTFSEWGNKTAAAYEFISNIKVKFK